MPNVIVTDEELDILKNLRDRFEDKIESLWLKKANNLIDGKCFEKREELSDYIVIFKHLKFAIESIEELKNEDHEHDY